jgi:hypothetical protein
MALHLGFQKVNPFTSNDFGDSPAQKKWFSGGLGPWNVKLGLRLCDENVTCTISSILISSVCGQEQQKIIQKESRGDTGSFQLEDLAQISLEPRYGTGPTRRGLRTVAQRSGPEAQASGRGRLQPHALRAAQSGSRFNARPLCCQ